MAPLAPPALLALLVLLALQALLPNHPFLHPLYGRGFGSLLDGTSLQSYRFSLKLFSFSSFSAHLFALARRYNISVAYNNKIIKRHHNKFSNLKIFENVLLGELRHNQYA